MSVLVIFLVIIRNRKSESGDISEGFSNVLLVYYGDIDGSPNLVAQLF